MIQFVSSFLDWECSQQYHTKNLADQRSIVCSNLASGTATVIVNCYKMRLIGLLIDDHNKRFQRKKNENYFITCANSTD